MNTKEQLFYKKSSLIFNLICKKDLEYFASLFIAKDSKTSLEHRKLYLKSRWLNARNPVYPKLFLKEYSNYPFSELTIHGKEIFKDANEFLEMDIERFSHRIEAYKEQAIKRTSEINPNNLYYYFYVFNQYSIKENQHIDYYTITYEESKLSNHINIHVQPPTSKSSININSYYGTVTYKENKIILSFENEDDHISALFNTDLTDHHAKYLVGVAIGIANRNKKIPIAKKVILSKKRLKNTNELYLSLNETEIIYATENSYKLKNDHEKYHTNFLYDYIEKINRLNQLFQTLQHQNPSYGSFYRQLAFKEFSSTNQIFQKIKRNHAYYVNYRKRIFDILLKSHPYENYQSLYIVMPTYQEDNIFEHESFKSLRLREALKQLSQKVNIEIIFIIQHCHQPFSYEFNNFLASLYPHIHIYFSTKDLVASAVNSIDFILTNNENFVISKLLRSNSPVFTLFQDKTTIQEHEGMYQKILNRSIKYEIFTTQKRQLCLDQHPLIKHLAGKWYFYLYGTQKFWQAHIRIAKDGTVTLINENGEKEYGEILHKEHQSVILLEDTKTKRLLTIIFDHQAHQTIHAFTVQVVAKQFQSHLDLLSIGLFSRYKLPIETAQNILGDVDDVRLLNHERIQERLKNYLSEKFYL